MIRTFIIETGESLTGPWQSIQKYRADIIGPEDPNEPGTVRESRACTHTPTRTHTHRERKMTTFT